MSDKVGREKEEEYFLRKEMELREKIEKKLQEEAHVARLKGEFGDADEAVLKAFEEAGFSRETVVLLHLVPLLEIAWADGKISHHERDLILGVAKLRGIVPGTPAYERLEKGLHERPKYEIFEACRRAIRIIFATLPRDKQEELKKDLSAASQQVAAASGGFLGLGDRVSEAEKEAIGRLTKALIASHEEAAKKVGGSFGS